MMVSVIFFFKQKTAYEMRISDWSSDVCSSDLLARRRPECRRTPYSAGLQAPSPRAVLPHAFRPRPTPRSAEPRQSGGGGRGERSEEHTSELQSLMRISYAVFCLKKTK